ncbi:MAG: ABC transporter ATP-binding protein/permease [Synergistaceae bacterium]|jgi:ATP-binding cassette subfamily B protein|nr:ABC transporter ATP-binding protein/permease [Synergistaceae bacterium]
MPAEEKKHPFLLLWEVSRGFRALYIVSFISMLLSVFCGFMLPQVIRLVVDGLAGDAPEVSGIPAFFGLARSLHGLRDNLLLAGALVIAVAAAGGVCSFIYRKSLAMSAEGLIKRLRDTLYSHIQYLPFEWHVSVQTGDIIQRCTSDVEIVRGFVSSQLTEIVRVTALVVFAYSIMLKMNFPMTLASFSFLPVISLYSYVFLRKASARFLAADEAEGALLAIAQENFTGVRVVRAFGREKFEVDRFDRQNRLYSGLWMRLGEILSTYWGIGDFLTGLQMTVLCVVGVWQAVDGNITVGEFIVFLTYNAMIIWPVRGLGRVLSEAGKTAVSLGRLSEILGAAPETDPPNALDAPVRGDIVFDRVSFSYGGAQVLKDVSFTARNGTTLGILGSTGAGKTTIACLICRLYDLEDGCGEIRIGGVDIRKFKRSRLRRSVGIVLQESFLYSRTIRENVASLSAEPTIEKIKEAASISQIDESIESFSHGYETIVGERGVTLSGGQKQRVAIARTILREPPIIIFDDSLSAVDTETDARIRSALAERIKDSTKIIIAHRITSLSSADEIMVMEDGRVVETGAPDELFERGGIYRRIRDLQQGIEEECSGEEEGEARDVLR